jgi:hypothetical protein
VTDTLHPSGYPWAEPVRTGWLGPDGLREDDATADLTHRVPLVAVGSNASPTVLRRKLGRLLASGVPVADAVVDGLSVGHSAHVSAGGYVAAAPTRGPGRQPVTLAWFDALQLAALDATEPNYRRVALPRSMPCRLTNATGTGPRISAAQVYESVHGVLGEDEKPLPLSSQREVFGWLTDRLPRDVAHLLSHDELLVAGVRERIEEAMGEAGLVLASGMVERRQDPARPGSSNLPLTNT